MPNPDMQSDTAAAAPANVVVIFGAGGDLTKRKLIPALYHLSLGGMLPADFAMVGIDRLELDSDGYRGRIDSEIRDFIGDAFSRDLWDQLLKRIYYSKGNFKDPDSYTALYELLQKVDSEQRTPGSYLFYLSTPPSFFGEIAKHLAGAGLINEREGAWRRIVIEKPFGRDLASAKALNGELHQAFSEHQIYRIDHYLGKETVQNIMAFRLSNEGIGLSFNAKVPGSRPKLGTVEMNFSYTDYFHSTPSTGYETLIYDCMMGDATLFKRADNIELSWSILQPILDVWAALPPRDFPNYAAGTWGPDAAEELLTRDGRAWHACKVVC